MTHTKDIEKVLYRIIEELSKENAPIIFKGALALKDLLYRNNPDLTIVRKTTNIDANWIDEYDKDRIITIIDRAVKLVNPDYKVELYREPANKKSMGLKVLDKDGTTFTKIDIDIMDNPFYIECSINDVNIKYSDFNKMMSDKLFSISGEFVFRRAKDLLDIYLILQKKNIYKKNIENNKNIDIVLSHTCPYKYLPREVFLSGIDQSKVDYSTEYFLDEIEQKLNYKKWYCGHFHTDKKIDKIEFLFENVNDFE